MKSGVLLAIVNEETNSKALLKRLEEIHFAVTDTTEEGDSILHLMVQSYHVNGVFFDEYLKDLLTAGADSYATNRQGKTFLDEYLLKEQNIYGHKVFKVLLKTEGIDLNRLTASGKTFFELIYHSNHQGNSSAFSALTKHPQFNPNQKTSKHNSIVLHMLAEPVYTLRDKLKAVIESDKTDANIQNSQKQTALAAILSDTQYKDMNIVSALINHPKCDINFIDQEGNNYLQLAVLTSQFQCEEIAEELFKKGIDALHRNKQGKSVIDLVLENKANRSEYGINALLIKLLTCRPQLMREKTAHGKTILTQLLISNDYSVRTKFNSLLQSYATLSNGPAELKEVITDCFNGFQQNRVTEDTMVSLAEALSSATIEIDVEYCLAVVLSHKAFYRKEDAINTLKQLKPKFDANVLLSHVKNLTKEHSEEQMEAIKEFIDSCTSLDRFDDEKLALEEQSMRAAYLSGVDVESKMFGHLFSLSGSVPKSNGRISLTGSFADKTAPFMSYLMNAYVAHCEKTGKHKEHLDAIKQVRNMTIKAMRFYFRSKSAKTDHLATMKHDAHQSGVEIITGWPRHGIGLLIKMDDYFRNNGGGCSTDATTEHYKITKPENLTETVFEKLLKDHHSESNKLYIQQKLHEILGLKFVGTIPGAFQTVGNCSFESRRIALKPKYRLVLPEAIADDIYKDTLEFFEQFYLQEYISRYSNDPVFPYLIMRLVIQRLMPDGKLELAAQLIQEHFTSNARQEIMQAEFMLLQWKLKLQGQSLELFEKQLQTLRVVINPNLTPLLTLLVKFLNDQVTDDVLEELKRWPADLLIFQGYTLLHIAVMNNHLALATTLIQKFPTTVNQENWFEDAPLQLAKSPEMVELLVKAGAKTDSTESDNALDCAIIANKPEVVLALLKHGAKPSEYTAFYAANKDPKILESLMQYHPKALSTKTHNYSTAAHAAAKNGQSANLHAMVYYGGANPAVSDVNGVTPLHLALKNGKVEAARYLIEYPRTLFNPPHRGDSVTEMTANGDLKRMIEAKEKERKADLEYFQSFKGTNPGYIEEDVDNLIVCIRHNNTRAIKGCLIAFPEIKVVSDSKLYCTSPLANAVRNVSRAEGSRREEALEIVQLLLKTQAININSMTPLLEPILFCALNDDVRLLELFLADPKLNPNLADSSGYTALHRAAEGGCLNTIRRLLMDERVDSTLLSHDGKSAADILVGQRHVDQCREELLTHQHQRAAKIPTASQKTSLGFS